MTAVLLCAGVGSRIGLPDSINKCAADINGSSAVRHGVAVLYSAGVKKIIIVIGHAADSLREALARFPDVQFVKNDKYGFHGCNYSVACGVSVIGSESDRAIIAEGDSLIHPESIKQIVECNEESAVLLRSPEYINPKRSVIAIGTCGKITRYAYDQSHEGNLFALGEGEEIIGESMQLWSFSGGALKELHALLLGYKKTADSSKTPKTESGIFSINKLQFPAMPVMSNKPNDWININTQHDLEKAKVLEWMQK